MAYYDIEEIEDLKKEVRSLNQELKKTRDERMGRLLRIRYLCIQEKASKRRLRMITEDDKHQFVAMDHCPICGEVVSIVMQTKFTNKGRPLHEMPKDVCTSLTPCDKCKEKAKGLGGVWCYEGRQGRHHPEPTGRIVMLTKDCVQRIFNEKALKVADEFGYLVLEPELFEHIMEHSEVNQ